MKKLFLVVASLLVGVSLFACAGGAGTGTGAGASKYGKGKVMSLSFKTNPTTGYDWEYVFSDGDAEIVFDREDYKMNEDSNLVGGESTRIYYFRASKEGKKKLTFTYARPWEGGEKAYDVVYELEVDKDLNITCTSKKKGAIESKEELSFFPDPVFTNE